MSNRTEDLAGLKFSRLTVVRLDSGRHDHGSRFWICKCECGSIISIATTRLTRGLSFSCGCYQRERARDWHITHGGSRSVEYNTWCGIIDRCENKNTEYYHRYGGRGITMCKRWRSSFPAFLADMGKRPSPKHSIDRINNDGNYEPGNCRWSTPKEQGVNKRSTVMITANGKTQCISDWVRETGRDKLTIRRRLRAGIPPEELFNPDRLYYGSSRH